MEQLSPKALELIKYYESLHDGDLHKIGLQPKMDPIGIWTEGYGHAMRDPSTGDFLRGPKNKNLAEKLSKIKDEAQAIKALNGDISEIYLPTTKAHLSIKVLESINQDQLGALVSFVYNCGTGYKNKFGKIVDYAIFKKVEDFINKKISRTDLYDYWRTSVIRSGGKVLRGLQLRRDKEAKLFLSGNLFF